jgi:hypothetical protein
MRRRPDLLGYATERLRRLTAINPDIAMDPLRPAGHQ